MANDLHQSSTELSKRVKSAAVILFVLLFCSCFILPEFCTF